VGGWVHVWVCVHVPDERAHGMFGMFMQYVGKMPCMSQRALNGVRDPWSFGIANIVYMHGHACTGHGSFGRGCKLQAAACCNSRWQHEQLVAGAAWPCMQCHAWQGQRACVGSQWSAMASVCGRWPW
jgi:hypothetical protein